MADLSSRDKTKRRRARFRAFTSILIAAVTVSGALVTWRISVASGRADAADARGLEAALNSANAAISLSTYLSNNIAFFTSYRQHLRAADLLEKQAAADPARRTLLLESALRERNLAATARGYIDSDYLEIDPADGSEFFNGNRYWEAQLASERAARPLDEKPFFETADAHRQKARRLVGLTVTFGAALFLLVAANIMRRRGRSYLAALGTLIFVLSLTAVFLVEFGR